MSDEVQKRFKFSDKKHDDIVGTTKPEFRTIGQRDLVYGTNGVMGCLVATDYKQPKQIIEFVSPKPELVGGIGEINYGKQFRQGNRVYSSEKTAMCLLSQPVGNVGGNSYLYLETKNSNRNFKIRKLIPLECFRLMGFDDEDYYILKEKNISDTQMYKQAGNSIVVNVLYYILLEIYKTMPYLLKDIKLGSFFSGIGAFEKAIVKLQESVNAQNIKLKAINN